MPAQAHRVGHDHPQGAGTGLIGHVIQITLRVGVLIVYGRRDDLILEALRQAMASTAPAAPIRCPFIDLVELTAKS